MGMLSRKRTQPRIVKKNKRRDKKQKKDARLPTNLSDSSLWNAEQTAKQNFQNMGLVMNVKPSMRQTNEGKALLTKARVRLNKAHYEKHGGILADDQEELNQMEEEKKEAPTADLTQVFPELNSAT